VKRLTSGLFGAVFGLGLLMAPLSTANAQFGVGLFVGYAMPTGDLGDNVKSGFLAGIYGAYRFGGGESAAAVRLDIMYGENDEQPPSSGSPSTTLGKLKLTYFLGYLVVHILPPEKSSVDLYFGGGGGFVSGSSSGSSLFPDESSTDGALSGLFGIAIPVGNTLQIFFEGKWVTVFTEGGSSNIIPAEAGVALSF
jgi:hypothetical protein